MIRGTSMYAGRTEGDARGVLLSLANESGVCGMVLAVLILFLVACRLTRLHPYSHPDEAIATSVVAHMQEAGKLETNWALAPDMPSAFKYPQHNFAGYHVMLAGWDRAARAVSTRSRLDRLRVPSCLAFLATVVVAASLTHVLTNSTVASLFTAACTSSSVQLFQDSLYARPEAWASLLVIVMLTLLTSKRPAGSAPFRILMAAFLVGYLVSIKISFIGFVVLPFVAIADSVRNSSGSAGRLPVLAVAGLAACWAGLIAGMPHAHWDDYWFGIKVLREQYSSEHWPHGLGPAASFVRRALHGLSFVGSTIGLPIVTLSVIGMVVVSTRAVSAAVAFVFSGLYVIYFMSTPVVFERNFSHALPLIFVAAGVGFHSLCHRISASAVVRPLVMCGLASICLAMPLSVWGKLRFAAMSPHAVQKYGQQLVGVQDRLGCPIIDAGYDCSRAEEFLQMPGEFAVRINDFGSRKALPVGAKGSAVFAILGGEKSSLYDVFRVKGPFHGLTTCTLHTYFRGDDVFIKARPRQGLEHASTETVMSIWPFETTVGRRCGKVQRLENWSEGGQYPDVKVENSADVSYGSWNDSDSKKGLIEFDLGSCRRFGIKRVFGPVSDRQILRVTWVESEKPRVFDVPVIPIMQGAWLSMRFELPAAAREVHVIAEDQGDGWGEWSAVTVPICFESLANSGHDDAWEPGIQR